MQDMIKTSVIASLFDSDQIVGFLYDKHEPLVAGRARAIVTRIEIGNVEAGRAENYLLFDLVDGMDQPIGLIAVSSKDMKGNPLS
jgi:hypothetical protein